MINLVPTLIDKGIDVPRITSLPEVSVSNPLTLNSLILNPQPQLLTLNLTLHPKPTPYSPTTYTYTLHLNPSSP